MMTMTAMVTTTKNNRAKMIADDNDINIKRNSNSTEESDDSDVNVSTPKSTVASTTAKSKN